MSSYDIFQSSDAWLKNGNIRFLLLEIEILAVISNCEICRHIL